MKGEEKLGKLISLLLAENRHDDIARAATNKDARKKLYEEKGIVDD